MSTSEELPFPNHNEVFEFLQLYSKTKELNKTQHPCDSELWEKHEIKRTYSCVASPKVPWVVLYKKDFHKDETEINIFETFGKKKNQITHSIKINGSRDLDIFMINYSLFGVKQQSKLGIHVHIYSYSGVDLSSPRTFFVANNRVMSSDLFVHLERDLIVFHFTEIACNERKALVFDYVSTKPALPLEEIKVEWIYTPFYHGTFEIDPTGKVVNEHTTKKDPVVFYENGQECIFVLEDELFVYVDNTLLFSAKSESLDDTWIIPKEFVKTMYCDTIVMTKLSITDYYPYPKLHRFLNKEKVLAGSENCFIRSSHATLNYSPFSKNIHYILYPKINS